MDLRNLVLFHLYFLDDLDLHVIDNHVSQDLLGHDLSQMMEKNENEY